MTRAPGKPMANKLILASAGTGKTFALSNRYLQLLVDGIQPERILATTFTRKAAGEILDRVVVRLAKGAMNAANAEALSQELDRPDISDVQFNEILLRLLKQLNLVQIQTLDSFFARLARTFSLELGLGPDWQLVDESEMQRIRDYAIRLILASREINNLVHDIAHGEASRSISDLIRNLVDDVYSIYRECVDTGTLGAWDVVGERKLLEPTEIAHWIGVLREMEIPKPKMREALEGNLKSAEAGDWRAFLKGGIARKVAEGDHTFYRAPLPAEIVSALLPLTSHAANHWLNLVARHTRAARDMLERFHRAFDRLKRDEGARAFSDLSYLAGQLLRNRTLGEFAWRLDRQVDHLLLDEFQDTSIEQWNILRPIAMHSSHPEGDGSFFCVGDVKQAIYGWRGGVAGIFDDVIVELGPRLGEPGQLNRSRRSSPQVIEMVNTVFLNMGSAVNDEDLKRAALAWSARFPVHETHRTTISGYALVTTSDPERHEEEVACRIRDLAAAHPGKSIGVLARTNEEIAQTIFQLGLLGVRASEEGGNPLIDSAAVNVLLAALRLLDHPDDMVSRFHLLHSPLASEFALDNDNWNIGKGPVRLAAQTFRRRLLDEGYGKLLSAWAGKLEESCTNRESFRMQQLIDRVTAFSSADHTRTKELIQYLESTRIPDPLVSPVRVMTIHKAKGLEFDIVVLPFLHYSIGRSPAYVCGRERPTGPVSVVTRCVGKDFYPFLPTSAVAALESDYAARVHEALCTAYVALTRARFAAYVIVPGNIKPENKSIASMILAALGVKGTKEGFESGIALWSTGDPAWDISDSEWKEAPAGSLPQAAALTDSGRLMTCDAPVRFAASRIHRLSSWSSPSFRPIRRNARLADWLAEKSGESARLYGTMLHACFEEVGWIEDFVLDEATLRERFRAVEPGGHAMGEKVIADFRRYLEMPNVRNLLSRRESEKRLGAGVNDQMTVEREFRFAVRQGDQLVHGTIDRLTVVMRDSRALMAEVADFKTDRPESANPADIAIRSGEYEQQIRSYRSAVSSIFGMKEDQITAMLVFPAIDLLAKIG